MAAFSFSYAPKASAALASINPIQSKGEGLRFAANTRMEFLKQNPEVVTEGFWKGRQALTEGIVKGTTSALSGVTGALAAKAAETKADTKITEDRAHDMAVAKIKAAPTAAETAYQQQRTDLLTQQIISAKEKIKESTEGIDSTAVEPGELDFSRFQNFKDPVQELPPPTATPVTAPAPASVAPPAAPAVPNAPVAPAGVSAFAPGDAGRGLFQFDQKTGTDLYGNVPPRQSSMAFNLAPLEPAPIPVTNTAVASTPAPAPTRTIFGQNDNPNFTPLRENIRNRGVVSEPQPSVAPLQELNYSTINLPPSAPEQQLERPFELPIAEVSIPRNLPKTEGDLALTGATLPLMPISGAEDKPLTGTPPPVEPPLPVAQPAVPTQPTELTKEQYDEVRYQIESELTGRPFKSLADARRATQVLEQTLGVKAQITTEKGEKGSRLHYVEIVDEAPAAKTAPEGYYTESIKDADGKETYVYKPKVPIESQVRSIDNGIKTAKILKQQIADIKSLSGGLIPGVGGMSSLMAKLPYPTDASTVRAINEGIKGLIGFKELVDLKAAGGSLGALSDSELKMLTSLQGSLDIDNLHAGNYLTNLKRIEESVTALEGGLEDQKQKLMRVENKTNFQPIQSEKPKYEKGVSSFVKDGYKYVWDGTEFKLSK
jgi:hypothetical protein